MSSTATDMRDGFLSTQMPKGTIVGSFPSSQQHSNLARGTSLGTYDTALLTGTTDSQHHTSNISKIKQEEFSILLREHNKKETLILSSNHGSALLNKTAEGMGILYAFQASKQKS